MPICVQSRDHASGRTKCYVTVYYNLVESYLRSRLVIRGEMKSRLNSENICYDSVHNLVSSRVISELTS